MTSRELTAPTRVPKLAVRNRDSQGTTSSSDTRPSEDVITPAPLNPSSAPQPNIAPGSVRTSGTGTDSSSASSSSNAKPTNPPPDAKPSQRPKKGSSFFGFLTLKEPSSSALQQYAEQQRKQAAEKGGRMTAVGLSGVSTQKLPPNVPKVNSKWDGLPEAAKARDSLRRSNGSFFSDRTAQTRRPGSANGSVSTFSSSGSRDPPPSLASYNPMKHARSYASSSSSGGSSDRARPVKSLRGSHGPKSVTFKSPSMSSLPETSYFFPPEIPEVPESPSDGADVARLSCATPPDNSPLTPTDGSPVLPNPKRPLSLTLPKPLQIPPGTDQTIRPPPNATQVIIHSSAADAAKPPSIARPTPNPDHAFIAGEARELKLPDEASLGSDTASVLAKHPSISNRPLSSTPAEPTTFAPIRSPTDTAHPLPSPSTFAPSPPRKPPHTRGPSRDDTASIAASVAPSEMSAQWFRSPRERLGLGGRIKRAEVLPWEVQGERGEGGRSPPLRRSGRLGIFGRR